MVKQQSQTGTVGKLFSGAYGSKQLSDKLAQRDQELAKLKAELEQLRSQFSSTSLTKPLDKIAPLQLANGLEQPRRYFDPEEMEKLTASVREKGVLEPILVRPVANGSYQVVAGERRYRAARAAGLQEIPAVEHQLTDGEALELALIENLMREDLNPVEETEGILNLIALRLDISLDEVPGLLHQIKNIRDRNGEHNVMLTEQNMLIDLFAEFGMTLESFVVNRLPLLKLPNSILEAVRVGKIAYTKAKAISQLKDEGQQQLLLEEVITQGLSLNQIKQWIASNKQSNQQKTNPLKTRFNTVLKKANQSKIWDDPKQQKKIEHLIQQIEALVESNS